MSDTTTYSVPEVHEPPFTLTDQKATITRARPDPDAWRAQLAGELADAEKELARDQKALEAARAKVDALTADVRFDEMKVASHAKGVAEFDRLTAKAAR